MKQPFLCKALTSLVLVFFGVSSEAKAQNDGPTGSFVIRNPSNNVIRYHVKWGSGDWVSYSLSPGLRMAHSHPLDFARQAPIPVVGFDGVGNGRREYRMTFFAVWADEVFSGKPYVFRYDASGQYLDLYAQ